MKLRTPLIALTLLTMALISFVVTVAARAKPARPAAEGQWDALMEWLHVPAAQRSQILEHDPQFAQDLRSLRQELATRRGELAKALEDAGAADLEIRQRSEAVSTANVALERRVTDHLLAIRHHLSSDQQKTLFGLCAEGVREGCGWRWRSGQSACTQPVGPGRGQGRMGR